MFNQLPQWSENLTELNARERLTRCLLGIYAGCTPTVKAVKSRLSVQINGNTNMNNRCLDWVKTLKKMQGNISLMHESHKGLIIGRFILIVSVADF